MPTIANTAEPAETPPPPVNLKKDSVDTLTIASSGDRHDFALSEKLVVTVTAMVIGAFMIFFLGLYIGKEQGRTDTINEIRNGKVTVTQDHRGGGSQGEGGAQGFTGHKMGGGPRDGGQTPRNFGGPSSGGMGDPHPHGPAVGGFQSPPMPLYPGHVTNTAPTAPAHPPRN